MILKQRTIILRILSKNQNHKAFFMALLVSTASNLAEIILRLFENIIGTG